MPYTINRIPQVEIVILSLNCWSKLEKKEVYSLIVVDLLINEWGEEQAKVGSFRFFSGAPLRTYTEMPLPIIHQPFRFSYSQAFPRHMHAPNATTLPRSAWIGPHPDDKENEDEET